MKFRNIITLLFTFTIFSGAYSMSGGRRSPLSQEVDLDSYYDSSYQSVDVSRENLDFQSYVDPQRFAALNAMANRTTRNFNNVKKRYKRFKSNITKFHIIFVENALKTFHKNKETYSEEKFNEFIDKAYDELIDAVLNIDMLRILIVKNIPDELSNRLIIVLDSVRLEIIRVSDIYLEAV